MKKIIKTESMTEVKSGISCTSRVFYSHTCHKTNDYDPSFWVSVRIVSLMALRGATVLPEALTFSPQSLVLKHLHGFKNVAKFAL